MAITNRYEGLLFLKKHGLPVPEMIKVSNQDEIYSLNLPVQKLGWTIRTCRKDGQNEFSLFYSNNLDTNHVKSKLLERSKFLDTEFYIIYPSWDFYFSFNLLKFKYNFIIEGTFGSQKDISTGTSDPCFSLKYNGLTKSFQQINIDNQVKVMVLRAINSLDELGIECDYYSEVAITRQKKMWFYEFRVIN